MYASRGRVEVDEATDKRLKMMIDKRVLVIMILTYFLQALDKGTMSFSSIMGIKTDAHLEDGQKYSWLTTCIYIAVLVVEVYLIQPQTGLQGSQSHSTLPTGSFSGSPSRNTWESISASGEQCWQCMQPVTTSPVS